MSREPSTTFRFESVDGQWREVTVRNLVGSHYRESVDVLRGLLVASGLPFRELVWEYGSDPISGSREVLSSAGRHPRGGAS